MLPLLLALLACSRAPLPVQDTEHLVGEGVLGELRVEPGGLWGDDHLLVHLYGPALSTAGAVPAAAEVEGAGEGEGPTWVYFPLGTALGEAQAALRLQGREAMLPLGARPGEHELRLERRPGPADPAALAQAQAAATPALDAARQAWAEGAFRLEDPALRAQGAEPLVGELRFRAGLPPVVAVYDRLWWTGAPVVADRLDEGADIVLAFPVEPTVRGEDALLRVNAVLGLAVVPADRAPTDLDRVLELRPGDVSEEERARAMERARRDADEAEREALAHLGARIARAAARDGGCLGWSQLPPGMADLLVGYDVVIVAEGGRCVVEVEPTVRQHRRRIAARVGAEGLLPHTP